MTGGEMRLFLIREFHFEVHVIPDLLHPKMFHAHLLIEYAILGKAVLGPCANSLILLCSPQYTREFWVNARKKVPALQAGAGILHRWRIFARVSSIGWRFLAAATSSMSACIMAMKLRGTRLPKS